jgi:hypothetical protein
LILKPRKLDELGVMCQITSFNNNNNKAFYSQTSWGRLEMKPYEPKKKTRIKQRAKKKGKTKGDKKPNKKKEKRQ